MPVEIACSGICKWPDPHVERGSGVLTVVDLFCRTWVIKVINIHESTCAAGPGLACSWISISPPVIIVFLDPCPVGQGNPLSAWRSAQWELYMQNAYMKFEVICRLEVCTGAAFCVHERVIACTHTAHWCCFCARLANMLVLGQDYSLYSANICPRPCWSGSP
jgi:hypothetical protein